MEVCKSKPKAKKAEKRHELKQRDAHAKAINLADDVLKTDKSVFSPLDEKDDCQNVIPFVEEAVQQKEISLVPKSSKLNHEADVNPQECTPNFKLMLSEQEPHCIQNGSNEELGDLSLLTNSMLIKDANVKNSACEHMEQRCVTTEENISSLPCAPTYAQLTDQLLSKTQTATTIRLENELSLSVDDSLRIYPSLKSLQRDVSSFGVIVKTHAKTFEAKTSKVAEKSYQDFIKEQTFLENHELFDLLRKFERMRQESAEARVKLKAFENQLKNKKSNLWNTVSKKAVSKGKCEDGSPVDICFTYSIKELDKNVVEDIAVIFRELEEKLLSDISFYSYTDQLVKLQIERYIYDLLSNSVTFADKSTSSPLAAFVIERPPKEYREELLSLRKCISILFHFQRRPVGDKNFINLTRRVLSNLIGVLLRSGTVDDNLFIINHVLRCPSGINSWAARYVQLPLPPLWSEYDGKNSRMFGCDYLDHCLIVLRMLLNPIPARDEFLKHIKSSSPAEASSSFVILDSDGEEEDDEVQYCKDWTEEDVISLLYQIPLKRVYQHVMLISEEGAVYDVLRTTEDAMQKLFGFTTFLFDVFHSGLKMYSCKSYQQLTEILGRMMRHTLHYVSDHWQNYKAVNPSFECGLQAEYDRLFFHAVYNMSVVQTVGAWKFLSGLPFSCVSPRMLWNLLWIYHSPDCDANDEMSVYAEKDVDVKLKSETVRLVLQEKLSTVGPMESLFLLRAFEKMALSREDDKEFVCCITREIFEASFVNDQLREHVAKEGRMLISSIIKKQPFVASFLIKEIDERDEAIGSWGTYLFKEVCLLHWIPEAQDIQKISDWLLCGSLSSPKCKLAKLILKKLNWGKNEEAGYLFLPMELHRQVGLLVIQAYSKYDDSEHNWTVTKGVNLVLQLYASIIGKNSEADQDLVTWAWELLFNLKLHVLDYPSPSWVQIYDGQIEPFSNLPDIQKDPWLRHLLRDFENKEPAACYLALVMTNIGCSLRTLTKDGLEIISTLVELRQYAAAIQGLYYILPFFAKHPELLTSNQRFMHQMHDLIVVDQTLLNSIANTPVVGAVLKNIAGIIKHQIFQAMSVTVEFANPLLKLWMHLLVKLLLLEDKKGLHQKLRGSDNQVYFLLDVIAQIGFVHDYTRSGIIDQMSNITRPLPSSLNESNRTSLWNMIFGSSEKSTSFLPAPSLPDYPWLMWLVISSENEQKHNQDIWLAVQRELIADVNCTPDIALKRASNFLKISCSNLMFLPIYRWCLQAINTPVSHPILPLLWQQFFLYYLQRTTNMSGSHESISIGHRFFCKGISLPMMAKMQVKLKESKDYYFSCVENAGIELEALFSKKMKNAGKESCEAEIKLHRNDISFYQGLLSMFRAFSIWLEDPELHKAQVCLPALEPTYEREKLKLILQGDQVLWISLVDVEKVKAKLTLNKDLWHQNESSCTNEFPLVSSSSITATESLLKRLESYGSPLPLPPVEPLKPPIDEISDNMLTSWDVLIKIIKSDQSIICGEAKKYEDILKRVKFLNTSYQSHIPLEFVMLDHKEIQKKTCYRSTGGTNGCAGAAVFHLSVKKMKTNLRIQERIEANRIDYHLLINKLLEAPPEELPAAAMHMDNCVRALVKKIKASKGQQAQMLKNMGISLFYHQIELTEKAVASVTNYAPSRQFFSSSVELLGREFIEGQDDQCFRVAETILSNPSAAGFASPFFDPNNAPVPIFLNVYDKLANSVEGSSNAIVVLLSKIDLRKWLNDQKVLCSDRKKLFSKIGRALINCGIEPSDELLPAYELFKRHFKILLLHQFPEHYDDAIHLLLNGMESRSLNVDIWYETIRCFGCAVATSEPDHEEIKMAMRKFAFNQRLSPDQQLFVFTQPFDTKQVVETLLYIYRYFHKVSQSTPQKLYEIYKLYLKPISVFLGIMCHSLMEVYSDESYPTNELSKRVVSLWEFLHGAFSIWIDPLEKGAHLVFPWNVDEEKDAEMMFQMFATCVAFHHEHLLGKKCDRNLLSFVWNYYVRIYVKPGLRNYSIVVCHSALLPLPWHEFYPSAEDIEEMCSVLQSKIPESREFLAEITMKIPWIDVMTFLIKTSTHDVIANTLCTLGKLLIISAWETSVIKMNSHQRILKSLENLEWHYLSAEMVGDLFDLYASVATPMKLLLPRPDDSQDIYVLQFLKNVSGMIPTTQKSSVNQKQLLFLNRHVAFLSRCVQENVETLVLQPETYNLIIPSLLREVDIILYKNVAPSDQVSYVIPLVREILGFLNNITDSRLQTQALDSAVSWLASNRSSPMLLPSLNVSCCSLTSMVHTVSIVECCIAARFDTELNEPSEALEIWRLISSFFHIPPPRQDEFLLACMKLNAHLTLFIYALHRLPQSTTSASRVLLLKNIVDWNRITKPNEKMEAKLILLWDKILELGLNLTSENEHQVVQCMLSSFCGVLNCLGEDRSRLGLLASVGLGKPSTLSVNFRFLCRSMAAYIYLQMPEKGPLRLELYAPGYILPVDTSTPPVKATSMNGVTPYPSAEAMKALECLKSLMFNKSYAALKSQVDSAVNYCLNPRFCLVESRQLLKELALQVFPNHAYLHVLNTSM